MIFVDCEASSLASESYPIEIAWVRDDGQSESHLIKPEPSWTDWSEQSEKVHGISRVELQTALPASEVAQRVVDGLLRESDHLISDNPTYEAHWVGMLLATIDRPPLLFHHLDTLFSRQISRMLQLNTARCHTPDWYRQARHLLDEGQTVVGEAQFTMLTTVPRKHRALADALWMYTLWQQVKEGIDRRLVC